MRAHTITIKARAGGEGRTKRAIVPSGVLTLSLAVVLFAAMAGTANAHRGVPMSLDLAPRVGSGDPSVGFGARQVGTTSPAQSFTLRVRCRPTVSGCEAGSRNPKIRVPTDYAQTNDCPPTMLSGQNCTINVAFAPESAGPKTGTLQTGRRDCVKSASSPQHHDHSCEAPTATLRGTGVRTETSPTAPLTLGATAHQEYGPLKLYAFTNHASTLVVKGHKIKKTKKATEPLGDAEAGYRAVIRVRLRHPSRFDRPGDRPARLMAKIKVAAIDEFGQRATEGFEKRFYLFG